MGTSASLSGDASVVEF